jgi:sortase (surface protein transpeptidase)
VVLPQDDPTEEASPSEGTPADEQEAAAQFYTISCLNEETGDEQAPNGDQATEEAAADTDNGGLPPFLQPTEGAAEAEATEDSEGITEPESSPAAATTDEEDCERGSVPQRLVIDSANVDYEVEVLEIIDGVMQPPTGPNAVAWYKETARLGEASNVVIAGHLNWWGVPEGPFFNLQNMQEGDRIEITGEDGTTYVYEVQWVQQESNLEPPDPAVVGPTGEQTLTLITCGGEWDASISEYNERTVVRAIQVETVPADNAPEAPATPTGQGEQTVSQVAWLAPRTWQLAA